LHPENEIHEKAANLLKIIIITLVTIYPMEISCFNPRDLETEDFQVFYLKKIGVSTKRKFEVKWHETSKEEKEEAIYWIQSTAGVLLKYLTMKYFDKLKDKKIIDSKEEIEKTIEQLNLSKHDIAPTLKNEIQRILLIISKGFAAIQLRCSQLGGDEDQTYQRFKEAFLFKEFEETSKMIYDFILNSFGFFLDTYLIFDSNIMLLYLKIVGQFIGEDE